VASQSHFVVEADTDQAYRDVVEEGTVEGAYHPSYHLGSVAVDDVAVDTLPFQNLEGIRNLVLGDHQTLVAVHQTLGDRPFAAFLWAFPLGGQVEVQVPSSY
jgi:hypothetical protein